jgi:hypothetical protein
MSFMTRRLKRFVFFVGLLVSPAIVEAQADPGLRGAWAAERYLMADGGEHEVQGRIFFSERDWQVLFFVMDENGEARRGSGEGGTYALTEGGLVFTHLFNLSVGDEMPGLPAAELQMISRPPEGAPLEPTDIRIRGDVLTLHFPSGNRMTFRRRG